MLDGGVGGETAPAGALLDSDVESILEEKNQLISRQYAEIERLQRELAEVVGERDALLCEVSKFKFEREMTDLKRLHDDRYARSLLLYPLVSASSIVPPPTRRCRKRGIALPRALVSFFFLASAMPRFKCGKCNATRPEKNGPDRDKNSFLRLLCLFVYFLYVNRVYFSAHLSRLPNGAKRRAVLARDEKKKQETEVC